MFSRILTIVEQRLSEMGILETLTDDSATGLFPKGAPHEIVTHTFLGPTWMDDLCVTVTGATAHEVESRAGAAGNSP